MQERQEKNMVIKLLRKNMKNELYISGIIILISKLILGLNLASIIYIFYKFISLADIKITIAFFEAKFMSLFSSFYKVAYTNKSGMRVEEYIPVFLNNSYVSYCLSKYKLALYDGIYLALFMSFTIIAMVRYFWSEIAEIIEDYKYQLLKEKQQIVESNQQPFKSKASLHKQNTKPIEYQDL